MQTRNYLLYDVFTTERLAGNPLAVVLDCKGLDTAAMQAIAREFNLSESVFVLPPDNPKHRNRIRIFTPDYEMPFAGQPT
ncbi:PhzF family phenazine biosynthesis protein, partial [Mesorhizobium sp. M8A.F.Ca.ET.059.01.1.1]